MKSAKLTKPHAQSNFFMKLKQLVLFVIISVLLRARIGVAQETTYLDNTSQPVTGTRGFNLTQTGAQFLTGTNAGGYVLNSLQLLFAAAVGSPEISYLRCDLLSDYYNSPAVLLNVFIPNDNPTTVGLHTFVPLQPLFALTTLDANTDYWLFFYPSGGSSLGYYRYNFTDSINSTSIDGWRVTGETFSPFSPGQTGLPMFSLNATAIPEPSTLALLATALAAICCKFRAAKQT
jgi:PEP-CTERM motif